MPPTDLAKMLAEARLDGARLDFLIKHCRCGRGQLDRDPRSVIDEAMNKRCGSCGKPMAEFKRNKIYCSVRCANRISKRMQREREKRNLNDRQT